MFKRGRGLVALSAVVLLAVGLIACGSDDDDKGTGTTMTPEEQVELLEGYGFDIDSAGQTLVPLMSTGLGVESWGGVSCEDLGLPINALGKVRKVGIEGSFNAVAAELGKRLPSQFGRLDLPGMIRTLLETAAVRSGSNCGYNESEDAWIVEMDTAMSMEAEDASLVLDMEMHDTIGFWAAGNVPQEEPDASTIGFENGVALDIHLEIELDDDSVSLDGVFDLELSTHHEITGLNTSVVTMNGGTELGADIDLTATLPDTTGELMDLAVDGTFDLAGQSDGVQVPKPEDELDDPCPIGGTMTADFSVDLKAEMGDEKYALKCDWEVDVDFDDGSADVTLQSGDYTKQVTTDLCEPAQ